MDLTPFLKVKKVHPIPGVTGLKLDTRSAKVAWRYIYKDRVSKKTINVNLGEYPTLDLDAAKQAIAAIQTTKPLIDPMSVGAIFERYVTNGRTKSDRLMSHRNKLNLRSIFRTHLEPQYGSVNIENIDPLEFKNWLRPLADSKPQMARQVCNLLGSIYHYLQYDEGKSVIPCTKLVNRKAITTAAKVQKKVHPILTRSAIDAFNAAVHEAPPRSEMAAKGLQICLATGARHIEVCIAEWSHMDLVSGRWEKRTVKGKGGVRITVHELSPSALDLLRSMREADPDGIYVCPGKAGQKRVDGSLGHCWRDYIRPKLGSKYAEATVHTLRHTYAIWLLVYHGRSLEWVQRQLGHESRVTTEEYTKWGYTKADLDR